MKDHFHFFYTINKLKQLKEKKKLDEPIDYFDFSVEGLNPPEDIPSDYKFDIEEFLRDFQENRRNKNHENENSNDKEQDKDFNPQFFREDKNSFAYESLSVSKFLNYPIDFEYIDEYEFIESMMGLPFHEVIVKSMDLDKIAELFLKKKFSLTDYLKDWYQVEINNYGDLIDVLMKAEVKEYLMTIIDYDLIDILRKVSEKFKILYADIFVFGIVNFLLKEFLLSLLENGKEFFGTSMEEEKELLKNKRYPIFMVNKKNPTYRYYQIHVLKKDA